MSSHIYGQYIDCDDEYVNIGGDCYFEEDLQVLQDFIDLNQALSNHELLEVGSQQWEEGRLVVLNLENFLNVGSDQLTHIPNSIGNLTNLTYLTFFSNSITSVPDGIGDLVNLEWLLLNENELIDLTESIGNLVNLEVLWLNDNNLTSLPEVLCNLPDDCFIKVSDNQLCNVYNYHCVDYFGDQDCSEELCSDVIFDLNLDLVVDILDVIIIVDCILSDACNHCSDFNADQKTDILDIIQMIGIILG